MQVINHELRSHQLLLENQPAAANPPQPVVEGSMPEPGAKEAAPQPAPPSEKTATAAVVPGPAPVTAQTSASASATAEMQRSAVDQSSAAPEKQKDEAAPSAATVNTAAPALKKEVAEQQQKQQESQQEPEAAQPAPAEPQQSAKEPGPKRKKAFSFFKREKCTLCPAHVSMPPGSFTHCRDHCRYWPSGDCCNQVYIYVCPGRIPCSFPDGKVLCCRQTEPQAAPLSADAIREAEDSSPPPEPSQQEAQQDAQSAPSLRQGAAQALQKAPLEDASQSQQSATGGIVHIPQEGVPLPSAVPPQQAAAEAAAGPVAAAAAEIVSGTHATEPSGEYSNAAAQAPSTEPQGQHSDAAVPEQSRDGNSSSAIPASSPGVVIDALPAAKTLPEQGKPVPLTPRTPREDKGSTPSWSSGGIQGLTNPQTHDSISGSH